MRDFTKSMFSFSWVMSLFGLQQMTNMLLMGQAPGRPRGKAAEAFESVARATEEQLGDALKETFKAGDKFQRGMLDMMFGAWMTGGMGTRPMGQMMEMPMQAMQQGMQGMQQMAGCCGQPMPSWAGGGGPAGGQGWGPMPASEAPAAGNGTATAGAARA
jgi:hypothetical protein